MDRKQSGVRARGNSIQIEFSYQGIRCRETIKLNPTKTNISYAARKKAAIEYDIEKGAFDYFEHFPNSKKALKLSTNPGLHITIKEQLNKWLKIAQKRCEYSTVQGYKGIITGHLEPEFGHLKLNELKASMVEEWVSCLDISNKRINNILSPLRQALESAYEEGLIDRNPLYKFKSLKVSTREPDPFSKTEIQAILDNLDGQAKNIIQFAFWTGLRTGELIALQWKDIDLEKRKFRVTSSIVRGREKGPKTGSGYRNVSINQHALTALERQKKYTFTQSKRVFHDPRTNEPGLNDQNIRKSIWKPALRKAGITYRTPYLTRHTFASMMLMEGKTPFWVANQMGHSKASQTFQSYARWIDDND